MQVPTGLEITELSTDGVTVMLTAGDLDIATAPQLCSRLQRRRGERIVLDLSDTTFCDIAAMRALIEESLAGRARGGYFALVAPPSSPARRLLDVAGLLERVEVHEERSRAISRLRPVR